MAEYRLFYLTPGQQAPAGSTSQSMPDGGIVWIGEEGTFPKTATIDRSVIGASFIYINHIMDQAELDEYNMLLKYISTITGGYEWLISFDDFKDPNTFSTRKTEIKLTIDGLSRI